MTKPVDITEGRFCYNLAPPHPQSYCPICEQHGSLAMGQVWGRTRPQPYRGLYRTQYRVRCSNSCGQQTPWFLEAKSAIDFWNGISVLGKP
jgi:hypothetical protein